MDYRQTPICAAVAGQIPSTLDSSRRGVYSAPWNRLNPMYSQLFAGVGLGLLVGILVGLSSSPVVSVVVGALAAGMVTLLGFTRSSKGSEPSYSEGSTIRLGGFGVACAAAVIWGLFIRTHNWASPSIAEQVSDVQKAGYSGEEARRWVAVQEHRRDLATRTEQRKQQPIASQSGSRIGSRKCAV